jgi:hypothetical protein
MNIRLRTRACIMLFGGMLIVACNPFAPGFDDESNPNDSILGDARTVDGVFQNVRYAYTFKDTTIYGQLLHSDYSFVYRDYERGVDVSWGRTEEMRITSELFRNVQKVDLVWNNIVAVSSDSSNTNSVVSRNFNLTFTFNPTDVIRVDGFATLTLTRAQSADLWQILRWRDESNF